MNTTRFLMIRHGRTAANVKGILMGRADAPLLPESIAEATQLGRTLSISAPTIIHSSDQPRALRTAELIAHGLGTKPIADPHLRERDFGDYTGRLFADLAHDPAWPAIDTHYDQRPINGESLNDVERRIFNRLRHLHDSTPTTSNIIVVGHSTCWRLVQAVLAGRRQDPFNEPIPEPLTVLEHPRHIMTTLHNL